MTCWLVYSQFLPPFRDLKERNTEVFLSISFTWTLLKIPLFSKKLHIPCLFLLSMTVIKSTHFLKKKLWQRTSSMYSYLWLFIPIHLKNVLHFSNPWCIPTQNTSNTHRPEANLGLYISPRATNSTSSKKLSPTHKSVTMDEFYVVNGHLAWAMFLLTKQHPPTNSYIAKAPSRGPYCCCEKQQYKPKKGIGEVIFVVYPDWLLSLN